MFRNKNWKRCFEGQRVWLGGIKPKFLPKEPQLSSIFNRSFRQKFSTEVFKTKHLFCRLTPEPKLKRRKIWRKKMRFERKHSHIYSNETSVFKFPMQGTNYNIFVRIFKQKLSAVKLVRKLSLVVSGNMFGILTGKKHDWKSQYFRLLKS